MPEPGGLTLAETEPCSARIRDRTPVLGAGSQRPRGRPLERRAAHAPLAALGL